MSNPLEDQEPHRTRWDCSEELGPNVRPMWWIDECHVQPTFWGKISLSNVWTAGYLICVYIYTYIQSVWYRSRSTLNERHLEIDFAPHQGACSCSCQDLIWGWRRHGCKMHPAMSLPVPLPLMWLKQCHKLPIWEWCIPPICGDFCDGLLLF